MLALRNGTMSRHRKMRVEPLEDRRMLAVSFTGGSYSQNFDTLPTSSTIQPWTNDSTLQGWHLFRQPGTGTVLSRPLTQETAEVPPARSHSFGKAGAAPITDRALGGIGEGAYFGNPSSGSVAGWMALALENDTVSTVNEVRLNYTGERWCNGSSNQTMTLEYGVGAAFNLVPSGTPATSLLNFFSSSAGTSGAKDGNSIGNRSAREGVLTNLNWTAGSTLWIRWVERNDSGGDQAFAVDDVQIGTIPFFVDTLVDENDGNYSGGDRSLREVLCGYPRGDDRIQPRFNKWRASEHCAYPGGACHRRSLTIQGPGSNKLTIDASGNDPTPAVNNGDGSGIFFVDWADNGGHHRGPNPYWRRWEDPSSSARW